MLSFGGEINAKVEACCQAMRNRKIEPSPPANSVEGEDYEKWVGTAETVGQANLTDTSIFVITTELSDSPPVVRTLVSALILHLLDESLGTTLDGWIYERLVLLVWACADDIRADDELLKWCRFTLFFFGANVVGNKNWSREVAEEIPTCLAKLS